MSALTPIADISRTKVGMRANAPAAFGSVSLNDRSLTDTVDAVSRLDAL